MEASDFGTVPETLIRDTNVSAVIDWEKEVAEIDRGVGEDDSAMKEEGESLADLMVCDSGARMVPGGFNRSDCAKDCVMFVNAGCDEGFRAPDANVEIVADARYEGGEAFRTEEHIDEAGDCPFIYQSARLGNCCYRFDNLAPGHYSLDLHFSEIINTNGPKGMRVFNVFLQDEKVLSEFDIFAVVGSNKPLQIVNLRASVKDDGVMRLRFNGINGSPLVSGICIKKATNTSGTHHRAHESFMCKNCSAEIECPSAQLKLMQARSTAKLEKELKELREQFKRKNDECYEAWMSLTAVNEQLEQSRMDLAEKRFEAHSKDQTVRQQARQLSAVSGQYEHDKKFWDATIAKLEEKLKVMKEEQAQLSREAHECADSIPELTQMVSAVQGLVAQCEDLKLKYNEELTKRKKLYNQVQEAKGNIRVFCRCRPLSKQEMSAGYKDVVDFEGARDGDLAILAGGSLKKIFKFDRVYTPNDDQVDVFADASPLVVSVLDGFNVCIFAYGQTGTGKTFTMEGPAHNRGVNYRTVEQLFEIARERSEMVSYDICVSVLEVYNEQLRDLLAASPSSKKLEIKQGSEGSHHVPGIVEAKVESLSEVWNVLQAGSSARAVGSNNVNEHSSRSHCMLCITVKARNLLSGECTRSKLWLVDLAGSERLAKTDAQGDRLKEAQNINKSLSALGDVISALASKSSHIPYRNSKLTHLLQDSLGGDSKTLMFVQISPSENDLGETLSSLNFATRVRGVELGPVRKQVDTGEIQKLKTMLEKARQEARSKDELLRKLEESLQNMESKARSRDHNHKNQQEQIRELENLLEMKAASHGQSEKQLLQLSERLRGKEETCASLQHKVKELESRLREREQSESAAYEQKIKELEMKLKDKVQESEYNSLVLHRKIKELEKRLRDHEQNPEMGFLQLKVKELEEKLRRSESLPPSEAAKATPNEAKRAPRDSIMSDVDSSQILRSSNSTTGRHSQGSILLKGAAEPLQDRRRKRDSKCAETENATTLSSSLLAEKKMRQGDPGKAFGARVSRPGKPGATGSQRAVGGLSRLSRDPQAGVPCTKDKDSKKRIWSR
uniref:Kinesin motor domain-containing protein n=1 Tax=Kalanchoe fedtschenkoi TaxID=63787 RepID=A0A7N0T4S7_KALFE